MLQLDDFGEQTGTKRRSHLIVALVALLAFTLPAVTLAAPSVGFKDRVPALAQKTIDNYGEMINIAALLHDEDGKLIASVIVVESEGNPKAVSGRGAQGLMQLMPPTAKAMGALDAREPMDNILAGTKYIKHLKEDYGFTTEEALVAYNMGPTRAKRWLSQYDATDFAYVQKILYVYNILAQEEEKSLAKAAPVELVDPSAIDRALDAFSEGAKPLWTKPQTISMAFLPVGMTSPRRTEVVTE